MLSGLRNSRLSKLGSLKIQVCSVQRICSHAGLTTQEKRKNTSWGGGQKAMSKVPQWWECRLRCSYQLD